MGTSYNKVTVSLNGMGHRPRLASKLSTLPEIFRIDCQRAAAVLQKCYGYWWQSKDHWTSLNIFTHGIGLWSWRRRSATVSLASDLRSPAYFTKLCYGCIYGSKSKDDYHFTYTHKTHGSLLSMAGFRESACVGSVPLLVTGRAAVKGMARMNATKSLIWNMTLKKEID